MATFAAIAALLLLLAGAVWLAVVGWNLHGDVPMSGHGYAAMALGIIFSLIVGCGLIALMYYSHRHGYDEPPEHETKDRSE